MIAPLIMLAGWGFLLLGVLHLAFARYFDWKNDLSKATLINRQMMEVHTFFIGLTVFLMGLLCVTSSQELVSTPLGKKISAGFAIFWGIRLATQFFWYSPSLWRGKRFETSIHILFSLLWLSLTVLFTFAALPDEPSTLPVAPKKTALVA